MKTLVRLFAFLFLLPSVVWCQSKTWLGTPTLMWPAQATNALVIDSKGTNTLTLNNTNAYSPTNIILRMQRQSTNVLVVDEHGSQFIGIGALERFNDPEWGSGPGIYAFSDNDTDPDYGAAFNVLFYTHYSEEGDSEFRIFTAPFMSNIRGASTLGGFFEINTQEEDHGFTLYGASGNDGWLVLKPDYFNGQSCFQFNVSKKVEHDTGPIFSVQNATTNAFTVMFDGAIKTANPGNGVGSWKLGDKIDSPVTVNTNRYIEVDIGGTVYKLLTAE